MDRVHSMSNEREPGKACGCPGGGRASSSVFPARTAGIQSGPCPLSLSGGHASQPLPTRLLLLCCHFGGHGFHPSWVADTFWAGTPHPLLITPVTSVTEDQPAAEQGNTSVRVQRSRGSLLSWQWQNITDLTTPRTVDNPCSTSDSPET